MTFPKLAVLCALSPWTLLGAAVETGLPDSTSPSIVHHSNVQAFRTPFFFERNKGQYAPEVKFYHRSRDYSFFLTATEMVTVFRRDKRQTGPSDSLKIKFLGTQSWARAVGEDPLESRSHYFLGDRPDRWVTGVEHFQRVRIANLYPGIDAVFYGRRGKSNTIWRSDPVPIHTSFAFKLKVRRVFTWTNEGACWPVSEKGR